MKRVRLIHWRPAEAADKVARLTAARYAVDLELPAGPAFMRELRQDPPDVIVIDLDRLPAQGRDLGLAVRHYRTTRHLPLVFAGGDRQKVAGIEKMLPDAVYTSWERIRSAVRHALAHPPRQPVKPLSLLAGYAGTPLPRKLGIKQDMVVALIGAPEDFATLLCDLPSGVVLRQQARGRCDLIIWFVDSRRALHRRLARLAARTDYRSLWIAWPKQASGVTTDLTQQVVREAGLAAGLVDYKICSIDSTWSGLLFTHRKQRRR